MPSSSVQSPLWKSRPETLPGETVLVAVSTTASCVQVGGAICGTWTGCAPEIGMGEMVELLPTSQPPTTRISPPVTNSWLPPLDTREPSGSSELTKIPAPSLLLRVLPCDPTPQ